MNTWQQLYPRKNRLKFEVLVFEERGKAEYQEKKPQEARTNNKPSHMGSVWGRLLLRLQEVYNANIQSRLPVITYSRINIYTERKERECSSAVLALSKKKTRKCEPSIMHVRGFNNVGRAVKTDPKLLRYASVITEQKKCWELLAQKFDRFQTLRNNSQQHATGCANGRNM